MKKGKKIVSLLYDSFRAFFSFAAFGQFVCRTKQETNPIAFCSHFFLPVSSATRNNLQGVENIHDLHVGKQGRPGRSLFA